MKLKAHIIDHFENLLEYHQWVNQGIQNLSQMNRYADERFNKRQIEKSMLVNPLWFGTGVTYEQLKQGITEFVNPELIDKIYNQISENMSVATQQTIKRKKTHYNPNGLGVFVFDRAAMGMFRLKEFYSPSLDMVVEKHEVKEVHHKEYQLIRDSSPVIERWEEKNGKPKIRTNSKNVYAYFEKVNKSKQAVELVISCGASSKYTSKQLIYSGMSAIVVAKLLQQANIPVRIWVAIGSSPDGFEKTAYACLIPVKNYDQTLDINLLALLTSDPRFFRYEGFKGIVALYDHFKQEVPSTLGTGMTREYLIQTIENSTYSHSNKLSPNRFYFGWTFSEEEAIRDIENTIKELAKRYDELPS